MYKRFCFSERTPRNARKRAPHSGQSIISSLFISFLLNCFSFIYTPVQNWAIPVYLMDTPKVKTVHGIPLVFFHFVRKFTLKFFFPDFSFHL